MTSLGLPTELAESGDKKKGEDESDADDWRFVALVLKCGPTGKLDCWTRVQETCIHAGKFAFYPTLHGTPHGRVQKSSLGACPGHLLKDGDEEADLHLSRML